jgi:hypothetical protein
MPSSLPCATDRAQVRAPLNPGKPQGHRLHGVRRHRALPVRRDLAPWAHAELGLAHRARHRDGQQQDAPCRAAQGPGQHPDRVLPALEGAAGGHGERGRAGPAHRHGLHLEGQNLQDCDTLVNYDIHWNPVRIIQRFGRIDRLGSINERSSWSTSGPTSSWRSTSASNSASAVAWSCSTSLPPARRT